MKLIVPDIIVPAVGEKTLRQYKIARLTSEKGTNGADMYIGVTNRRIIQHAEENKYSQKSNLLHNEIYIENVGGISLFRGKTSVLTRFKTKFFILLFLFAAISAVIFWQAEPIFGFVSNFISDMNFGIFQLIATIIPLLIFALIIILMVVRSKRFILNMVIFAKDMPGGNIDLSSLKAQEGKPGYIVMPYYKDSHKMFSEISSLILDVQKFGPDEVLSHIDTEENAI